MNNILALLSHILIYGTTPILLGFFIRRFKSMALFYAYFGFLFVFTQLFAVFYSIVFSEDLFFTGGNIAYSSMILLTFSMAILNNNPKIVRNLIFIEFILNIFLFILYFLLYSMLSDDTNILNIYDISPEIFKTTIYVNITSFLVFILEIVVMFSILERIKRILEFSVLLLFSSFIVTFIMILCLDGFLFPLLIGFTEPDMGSAISGSVLGKFILGLAYAPFLLAFLVIFKEDLKSYLKEPFNVRYVLIPPRKSLLEELERVEKNLQKSEKKYYEAYNRANYYKDLFTHDMSHIIQNISLSIELLENNQNEGNKEIQEKSQEILEILQHQIRNAKNLISNIKKISTLEDEYAPDMKLEPINLLKYLENAVEFVKQGYQNETIMNTIDSSEKKVNVMANEFLFNVFENILINAIKYNENEIKTINIKISETKTNDSQYVKIEFIDNGIGISNSLKKEIFSSRKMELKGKKGSGLGLSFVSKIIDLYKGKIWVEDKVEGDPNKGSNFVIKIPLA
ncbi:MAG: Signal transduction histidine kinase [Promethearchaeota archaeon]|nr:MAG: Signal transduction histidine kinase [Candidatus Lokiarchaeota archaeon]